MLLHFSKYHNVDDMVIKPIEFHDDIEKLREREKYWIRELNTVFPYGLNDRIDFDGIRDAYTHVLSNSPKTIYSVFNKVKNNRTKKGSGMNRRNRADNWNVEEFFQELLDVDTFPVCREVKCRIMRLSNDQTMDLLTHVSHHLTSISTTVNGCNEFILYVIKDIAVHKLSRHHPSPVKKTANCYLVVDYVNGLLDDINLPSLINNREIWINSLMIPNSVLLRYRLNTPELPGHALQTIRKQFRRMSPQLDATALTIPPNTSITTINTCLPATSISWKTKMLGLFLARD